MQYLCLKLEELKAKYISNHNNRTPSPIEFDKFAGAEIIRMAVTGNITPIDYIAADGKPAGYNTALAAEIARVLKVKRQPHELPA